MTNLGLAGASSLQALNQWISVIDTNLTNTKRVAYKETRLSLRTNEVETIGKTFTHFGDAIQIPSASLMLDKTLILDYAQGMLNNTNNVTDFALDGKGYFILEDSDGKRFATRDGQFHFSNDGYLVNAQGLKVLTTGQDYVRVPGTQHFDVDSSGTSLASTKYGDRQLMVVNLPVSGSLFYSKYGFTTFDVGNFIPVPVDNSFDKTMDGLNPYLASASLSLAADAVATDTNVTLDSVAGLSVGSTFAINGQNLTVTGILGTNIDFVPPLIADAATGSAVKIDYQQFYTHNKATPTTSGNVTVDISAASQALVTAHTFSDFNNSFKFTSTIDADTIQSYGFNFGQKNATDTVSKSGFFAGLEGGSLVIRDKTGALASEFLPAILPAGTEYSMSLSMSKGTAILILSDATTGANIASVSMQGLSDCQNTYQSIGTNDVTPPLVSGDPPGATPGAFIALTSLHVEERDKTTAYDVRVLGGNADKLNSLVRQQFVEESTSTVADTLPMLNNAQKLFAAIGKIISVSNLETDDVNGLIR